MTSDWTLRPYAPGDEDAASRLFREVFATQMTAEEYRWKFVATPWPYGSGNVWLAESEGRIIGQFAGVPLRFKLHDQFLDIVQGCDVMTAPSFRRQGVLSLLAKATLDSWKKAGVPFLIGLDNEVWGSRRRYLNLIPQFRVASLWKPLRPERLLARRVPMPPSFTRLLSVTGLPLRLAERFAHIGVGDIDVQPVQQPGPEFDELWERLGPDLEAAVVRDRAWLMHRYFAAPNRSYQVLLARKDSRPVGYLAYDMPTDGTRTKGVVADLFVRVDDRNTGRALVHSMLTLLRAAGADSVHVPLVSSPTCLHAFRRMGFIRRRGGYTIVVIPLADESPDPALSDPNRWFTMAGDFDIV